MRISDWSSDVCSSDLASTSRCWLCDVPAARKAISASVLRSVSPATSPEASESEKPPNSRNLGEALMEICSCPLPPAASVAARSEEHTSELQSLVRISYAVFCLKKNTLHIPHHASNLPSITPQPRHTHT